MRISTYQKGQIYEERACRLLEQEGCRILYRNFRLGHIDIDIIARDPDGILVFAEVKYRARNNPQHPLQAVSLNKQRNISKAAAVYLSSYCRDPAVRCRFDVIAFTGEEALHIRDAFDGSFY